MVTIRPFNTYGPRQSARAVIPTIIVQALTGDEIRIGSLEPTRDLNYVEDVVRGFILAAKREEAIAAPRAPRVESAGFTSTILRVPEVLAEGAL